MPLNKLLEPGHIGRLEIRNRLVFPPMQSRAADEQGFVTQRLADYLAERAKGGVGLIIMQHSFCWPGAKLAHGIALWDDQYIPKLAELVKFVQAHGARIAIQLGGRGIRQDKGLESVAPSSIMFSFEPAKPRELTLEEIHYYINCYGEAGRRVREAGFDALEIHGAHGKLISQFLSPYTNRRTDEYGGSVENRTRFGRKIIEAIRQKAGGDFPIIFRMNADDMLEGGITIQEGQEQARWLVSAGADALHVSGGTNECNWTNDMSYFYPRCTLVHLSEAVKKVVDVPVIAVGKINDPLTGEQVLQEGKADFIALGRPLLADPYILTKTLEGRSGEIRRCIYCLNCTTWTSRPELKNRGIACTVNPSLLREKEFVLKPASNPRKVMVIGGGLAGMEAARTLAERGHRVTLFEKNDQLGGQWIASSWAEHKKDFKTLIPYLVRGMAKAGVDVRLNTSVTRNLVSQERPDAVVLALGAEPRGLDVDRPETGGPAMVQALDVILGKAETGNRVVVVGGRYIGMEVAEQLARQGKHVSLVEALEVGHKTINRLFGVYRNRLVESGVYIYSNSPVMRLTLKGVDVANHGSMLSLAADTVVLAVGTRSVDHMMDDIKELGIPVYPVGDCRRIGDALVAMSDGAEIGRLI